MELWRRVWRIGLAPRLGDRALSALQLGLASDDPRIIQKATTSPCDFLPNAAAQVCGACALAYAGWQGLGLRTVGEVSDFFTRTCNQADEALGEPAACRHFLDWFDHTRRHHMRQQLLEEVRFTLSQRRSLAA